MMLSYKFYDDLNKCNGGAYFISEKWNVPGGIQPQTSHCKPLLHQLGQMRYLLAQLEEVIIDLLWFIYPYVGERSFYIRYAWEDDAMALV